MLIYSKYIISSKTSNRGFTLTELIVVMAIATIMMTVVVVQQSKWNDQLVLNTQTYELALMIRQAQIYSLGVREYPAGTGDKFNIGYGVYFDQTNTRYIFFADSDGSKSYTNNIDANLEIKTFTRGVTINDVCGNTRCFFAGGGPLNQAGIVFFRPDIRANISLLNNGGQSVDNPPIIITLQSPNGKIASVKVESNGQISIQ